MLTPTINLTVAKGKENSYINPQIGKCYMCGEPGHKSNECLKRRQVNMADYEGEDDVQIERLIRRTLILLKNMEIP